MKRTKLILILLIIGLVIIVGIIAFLLASNSKKRNGNEAAQTVYYSQQECEQKTGKNCDFQTCDYIPEGKTFEEVCGLNFKKGWVPINSN